MKKSTVMWIIAIIVIAALAFSIYKFTGSYMTGFPGVCSDTDGGKDYFVKGIATYENKDMEYTDFCVSTGRLREYYCSVANNRIKSMIQWCDCVDGACVQ